MSTKYIEYNIYVHHFSFSTQDVNSQVVALIQKILKAIHRRINAIHAYTRKAKNNIDRCTINSRKSIEKIIKSKICKLGA